MLRVLRKPIGVRAGASRRPPERAESTPQAPRKTVSSGAAPPSAAIRIQEVHRQGPSRGGRQTRNRQPRTRLAARLPPGNEAGL
jgi:hypothetical protein